LSTLATIVAEIGESDRCLAALVLITSPTTLCVVQVACNNNTPILQHGGFYGQIC